MISCLDAEFLNELPERVEVMTCAKMTASAAEARHYQE